jgi:hypothetical protein
VRLVDHHKVMRRIGLFVVLPLIVFILSIGPLVSWYYDIRGWEVPGPVVTAAESPSLPPALIPVRPDPLDEWFTRMASSTFLGYVCSDGWRSPSTGRGTCSHHGGIKWARWSRNGSEVVCP